MSFVENMAFPESRPLGMYLPYSATLNRQVYLINLFGMGLYRQSREKKYHPLTRRLVRKIHQMKFRLVIPSTVGILIFITEINRSKSIFMPSFPISNRHRQKRTARLTDILNMETGMR